MKNTRLFKFLQLLVLACVMGLCLSCAGLINNGSEENATPVEDQIFNARSQSIERELTKEQSMVTLDVSPKNEIILSATATQTATSYWFFEYVNGALKVIVYVQDPIVYKLNGTVEYNDYVEVLFSNSHASSSATSVLVNAYGEMLVKDLSGNAVEDHSVTATVNDFVVSAGNGGWMAEILFPYSEGIGSEDYFATVSFSLSNSDSKTVWKTVDYAGIKTDKGNPSTYMMVDNNGDLVQNPNLYATVDGITVDGSRDASYGEFTDTVTLSGNRWYDISAVKTQSGVFVYTRALFNTSSIDELGTGWGRSTDFEFRLNEGATAYVNIEGGKSGVSNYVLDVVKTQSGQYLHTLEMFIDKELIADWTENENVQINYAWKSPNESAYILSDLLDAAHCDWAGDWHSYHRLGGLSTSYVDTPANLMISKSGLTTVTAPVSGPTIDGDLSEYTTASIKKGAEPKAIVEINGKVVDGDLYMAFTITHDAWSQYNVKWWNNDNLEMYINGEHAVVMFYDGELIIPAAIDQAAAVTTTNASGKLVTTLELYVEGNHDVYKVRLGSAGTGFGASYTGGNPWQSLAWDASNALFYTENGVSLERSTTIGDLTLDADFSEDVWTENVKNNVISTTAKGAEINIMGRLIEGGIVFGATVLHTVAPEVSINGGGQWYGYMNIEYCINKQDTQFIATVKNDRSSEIYSFCKTVTTEDGKYLSTFEVYVSTAAANVERDAKCVSVSFGGWFETGWAWLFGGNRTTPTHYVTNEGLGVRGAADDGVLRILTIGNSFSVDTMEYVGKIADSFGMEVSLGNLYIGGCSINTHLTNLRNDSASYQYITYKSNGSWKTTKDYKSADAIKSQAWDYISFQQVSQHAGDASTMYNLEALMDEVRAICNEDAQFIWHMTWAYQSDSTHSGFAKYNNDQATMYNAIIETTQSFILPNSQFSMIVPVGTAIQNARASILGDRLTRDGYHLNYYYGRYIASLTMFGAVTGMDISKVSYVPATIPVDIKHVCIEAAMNALKTPFAVTPAALR